MSDLINRQDAIDAINTWPKFGCDERCRLVPCHEGLEPYVHLRDVVTAIINLPSAQQWIPCSEKLPEKQGFYLTTVNWYGHLSRSIKHFNGKDFLNLITEEDHITAWMPLPEPYKGENNE